MVSRYPDYWELDDMEADRTELHDLADDDPARVRAMAAMYEAWAKQVGVKPWPLPGATSDPDVIPGYLRR